MRWEIDVGKEGNEVAAAAGCCRFLLGVATSWRCSIQIRIIHSCLVFLCTEI